MAYRLNKDECAVNHQGHQGDQHQLTRGIIWTRRRQGVVRKYQRQQCNGAECHQRGADAIEAEALLPVHQPADQQAQSDDAIQNDHDGGKYRVARQGCGFCAAREHQGHDERNLDQGHCQCQHQGAIGLANSVRDHLRMVDSGEHARAQAQRHECDQKSPHVKVQYRGEQDQARKHRRGNGPFR